MADVSSNSLVGYATNIEGNLNYWHKYLSVSKVLSRKDDTLTLNDNCQFVYGGDVCDRGSGDIRVLTDLVNLKLAYPDRVHFILGNRDINKLRIPFSLHPSVLPYKPKVYWLRKQQDLPDYKLNDRDEKMKWVFAFHFLCNLLHTSQI